MFTAEDYQKRYIVLKDMSISLDKDPIIVGLSSLTAKLAEVTHLRNRVSVALAEAIQNKSEAEIESSIIEHQFDAQLANLMITDEYVRGQKSDKSREAAAQTKMPELLLKKHYKEVENIRADAYEKFVRQIHDNLEAANNNVSRQISVVQMSVQLGEVDPSQLSGPSIGVRRSPTI